MARRDVLRPPCSEHKRYRFIAQLFVLSLLLPNLAIALVVGRQRGPIRRSSPIVLATAQELVAQAWHAKLAPELSAEVSKQAWCAKLDDQVWTEVVTTVSAQVMSTAATGEAKHAWLARLDATTWCAVAAAVAAVAARVDEPEPSGRESREAKRAWLARLDASSWAAGAETLVEVAGDAAALRTLREGCERGEAGACERLGAEEAAARAALGRLDATTWGSVSAAVATIAVEVTLQSAAGMRAEEIRDAGWLVQAETAAWGQPQSASLRATDLRGEAQAEEEADWVQGRMDEEDRAFRSRREAAAVARNAAWEAETRALRAQIDAREEE